MARLQHPCSGAQLRRISNGSTQAFISPDGHSVRYFIQTDFSRSARRAMDQVDEIVKTASGAFLNTTLADAKVAVSGYPVTPAGHRDYYERDIRLIAAVTVIVVLLILMLLLLRAVVRRSIWSVR